MTTPTDAHTQSRTSSPAPQPPPEGEGARCAAPSAPPGRPSSATRPAPRPGQAPGHETGPETDSPTQARPPRRRAGSSPTARSSRSARALGRAALADPVRFTPQLPNPPITALTQTAGDPASTGEEELAVALATARLVTLCTIEVLSGWRSADQLERWTTPSLYRAIVRRRGLIRRVLPEALPYTRCSVRRCSGELTLEGACEAMVLITDGQRVRATASRLVRRHGRWTVACLEIA